MAITGTAQEIADLLDDIEAAVDATIPVEFGSQSGYDAQLISRIDAAKAAAVAAAEGGITES